jgi:MFS family permease
MTMRPGVYKWVVVGMLWFVCLLNYADRMAIRSVFSPIRAEMGLSDLQLGLIGSSFMWVYALASPFAGIVGDRIRRKTLIVGGLAFWSLITLVTGLATTYWQLLACCALEGLGEAFYFPASMSLVSDYHGGDTRSRAMSIHQSSVYVGTTLGGTAAGVFAQYLHWRFGFYFFGVLGLGLATVLALALKEPQRSRSDASEGAHGHRSLEPSDLFRDAGARVVLAFLAVFVGLYLLSNVFLAWTPRYLEQAFQLSQMTAGLSRTLWLQIASVLGVLVCAGILASRLFRARMVVVLMAVFVGANLVANIFLVWTPSYLERSFQMSLSMAGLNGTLWLQIASVAGVLCAGVLADRLVRHHPGGRMITQTIGLFLGIPFLFLTGRTLSIPVLVLAMIGFGYFKGLYDANIWASLYDVVKPEQRATAVGFMNSIGWLGASIGPTMVGALSAGVGLSTCLSATAGIYLFFGLLMVWGVWKYMRPLPGTVPA